MEHFRIIGTDHKKPDVLIYRSRNEEGGESVIIRAIGIIDGKENMFAEEEVRFDTFELACRFISDFSVKTANDWCEKEGITYW